MKLKCICSLFLFCCLNTIFLANSPVNVYGKMIETEQKPEPAYAKWGRLAMKKAKEQYPKADIIDYLHVGRIQSAKTTTETFKLWLREDSKEFGVIIKIEFDTTTEQVKRISHQKTSR